MLPVFSCAQVRYGNTKADPDGGHALVCGCVACARRTQSPRLHLGASLVHVACRTPRQVNAFAVLRLQLCLAMANRCCIYLGVRSALVFARGLPCHGVHRPQIVSGVVTHRDTADRIHVALS